MKKSRNQAAQGRRRARTRAPSRVAESRRAGGTRAEAPLSLTQKRLQHLLATSPAIIYSCQPEADYGATFVSPNVTTQLGYRPEEFLADARFWVKRLHPQDASRVLRELRRVFERGQHTLEYRFRCKDGTYRWLHDELRLRRDAAGHPLEIVGSLMDITARKQMEEALQESQHRYRALFEDSSISMWEEDFSRVKQQIDAWRASGITDFKSYFEAHPEAVVHCAEMVRVIDVNRATLELYQARSKENFLEGLRAIFARESYDAFADELVAIARGETSCRTETIARTASGEVKNLALRWSVAPGYENTFARVLVSMMDITERQRVEQMRRDFVANVSHEFKTPLTAIQGFTEILLDGAGEDPTASRRFLEFIRDYTARLVRLTDDLLYLSLIEAGKLEMKFAPVPVADLIESCVEMLRYQAGAKQIELRVDCPATLPPVWGDAVRLELVLKNLLDNAVQYTPPGGRITVHSAPADGQVMIAVSDTGVGIPPGEQERIFERFYRGSPARANEVGNTGLGLSIAKHLVEAHQGRITVESDVGRGSTFSVFLPPA
ncbi:MAG TPA: ATP-binding protein [Candidatus Acidoferrales bacterium]|nr:ATP-binding protein [Candidatus Acidoferrales bacterium]